MSFLTSGGARQLRQGDADEHAIDPNCHRPGLPFGDSGKLRNAIAQVGERYRHQANRRPGERPNGPGETCRFGQHGSPDCNVIRQRCRCRLGLPVTVPLLAFGVGRVDAFAGLLAPHRRVDGVQFRNVIHASPR